MRLPGRRTPKVEKLQRRGRLAQLKDAAGYTDRLVDRTGRVVDRGAPVRAAAITALAEYRPPEGTEPPALLPLFAERVQDDSPVVAGAAAKALGQDGSPAAAWALVDLLAAKGPELDTRIRESALSALEECACPGIAERWCNQIVQVRAGGLTESDREDLIKLLAADPVADPRQRVFEALAPAIAAPGDGEPGPGAAETILSWCMPGDMEALAPLIEHQHVTEAAVRLAGQSGDQAMLEPLSRLLEHPAATVRSQAALALGELSDTAAVLALMGATSDPDVRVRKSAVSALNALGSAGVTAAVAALAHRASLGTEDAPPALGGRPWMRTLARLTDRSGFGSRIRRRQVEQAEQEAGLAAARSRYESLTARPDQSEPL